MSGAGGSLRTAAMALALVLHGAAVHASGHSSTAPRDPAGAARAALDAIVPGLLAETKVASVSVAIVEDGHALIVGAWGEQSPGVHATPASLYNLASMSKPIAAEVALRLVAKGTLSLDASMAPRYADPDVVEDPRHLRLTPRLALSHRTGFPNWRRETGGRLAFVRDPGTAFGYSGEGFEYLARFIEKATHTPFDRLERDLVFRPAGMRESASTRQPWFEGRIAVPHDGQGHALEPSFADRWMASDLVYSTAGDYARFLAALMRRDAVGDALATERMRIHTDRRADLCVSARVTHCPDEVGIGLGWETYRFGKAHVLMHTGKDEGVFTLGAFSPERRRGVVILTNGDNGARMVLPILDAIGADRDFTDFLRDLAG